MFRIFSNPVKKISCSAVSKRLFALAPNVDREVMEFDVLIVGAGPAGLATALRLKQLDSNLNVCVIEKGAEIGAHTLSGACIEMQAMNELIPDWKSLGAPIHQEAKNDYFVWLLNDKKHVRLPTPPQMQNHGNYIVSLGAVVQWLGKQCEDAGVDVFPGFAAADVIVEDGQLRGVITSDSGIAKDGTVKDSFAPGVQLRARQTVLGEGCRGSLTKNLFDKFGLRKNADPQTYGLGVKEVWEVVPSKFEAGKIVHTVGWPMDMKTYGGSWLYHWENNKVSLGFVVGLDYENTYLSPFQELQRWKKHPFIQSLLEGGRCISYGARTISEGGLQSLPKVSFPGGVLVGDSAGFVNVPKIKGTHNAMKSGMLAAEAIVEAFNSGSSEATSYYDRLKNSWVWEDLHKVRNIRPAFQWGFLPALAYSAVDTYLFRGRAPWTLHMKHADHECTKPAAECEKIAYPKPDGVISFDLLTQLARSGTNHEHDQPAHLTLKDPAVPQKVNLPVYDGPESRFCPAKVYEYVEGRLVINAQNCLHCKACDIKDPTQNINWVVPEGSGGPAYAAQM
ncbi:mitochondrial electron transfer flavoprotein-ubiquinone oxidoreductase [Andalucia godoyi]|uniref:Electron transfer flavoprotein-ubiquinone oxidoreductase n=1 Tax=Andalucia godoyi TaxID=505711 RepID=A0A8K0AH48_ANDGO|nr:mitochondrial electron transfer flavoprotein-ubiquinone oxidoreductase [Andalucia godoyi]|eukprot:ANDGO_04089.mRNA.1 mitochondrial electron transfer flavoprotein-ubiquinone oxidoreductase